MMDELILLDVSGEMIHSALENGVSMWPKLEGRFPQVSGITFAFDPSKPPGSRVNHEYVKVCWQCANMKTLMVHQTSDTLEQTYSDIT